jgi:hypothetical protein
MHLEAETVTVLCHNLGMLANSHLGLIDAVQKDELSTSRHSRIIDRSINPGTGAIVSQDSLTFKTESQKENGVIEAGEEFFVDYGNNYFHAREDKFGMLFPTETDYKVADSILKDFSIEMEEDMEEVEVAWDDIIISLKKEHRFTTMTMMKKMATMQQRKNVKRHKKG